MTSVRVSNTVQLVTSWLIGDLQHSIQDTTAHVPIVIGIDHQRVVSLVPLHPFRNL